MAGNAEARETVFALRREIARIEGRLAERLELPAGAESAAEAPLVLRHNGIVALDLLKTGSTALDGALGGGLPLAALTEIHTAQTRDAATAAAFALALCAHLPVGPKRPLLWIGTSEIFREAGLPYAPGLLGGFGIAPESLLVSTVRQLSDALWVAEEAARLPALAAVILELRGNPQKLDLTATRRLHRRAQEAGRPVLLLRAGAEPEPTAAPVRLVVGSAPAGLRHVLTGALDGSIGPPAFSVALSKSRQTKPAEFILEWNSDERAFFEREAGGSRRATHTRPVVSLSGDGAHQAPQAGEVVALREAGRAA